MTSVVVKILVLFMIMTSINILLEMKEMEEH